MATRFLFPIKRRCGTGYLAFAFIAMHLFATEASAQKAAAKPKPLIPNDRWTVLHRGSPSKKRAVQGLNNSPVFTHKDLAFTGPDPGDPSRLGKFQTNGKWALRAGHLVRTGGDNAALVIASADDFELQGLVDADGLGGWFVLLGWHKGTGYALYNVTLKTSGSPWILAEFKDGKPLADEQREINRHKWKGTQPMWLNVVDQKLSLKVGKQTIVNEHDLPNYQPGRLMIGTYHTQYGAKNVRIQTLRIRVPPKKQK